MHRRTPFFAFFLVAAGCSSSTVENTPADSGAQSHPDSGPIADSAAPDTSIIVTLPDATSNITCTSPAGCTGGQVCCASIAGGGSTTCAASCTGGSVQLCTAGGNDCPTGQSCQTIPQFGVSICRPITEGGTPEAGSDAGQDAGHD